MQRKPIASYCRQEVVGWHKLPPEMVLAHPGEEEFSCGFFNTVAGLHMMASVKDFGVLQVLHLSVGKISSYDPTMTAEEWDQRIYANVVDIAETFFPGRQFARQPDTPNQPSVKHYFAILGVDE